MKEETSQAIAKLVHDTLDLERQVGYELHSWRNDTAYSVGELLAAEDHIGALDGLPTWLVDRLYDQWVEPFLQNGRLVLASPHAGTTRDASQIAKKLAERLPPRTRPSSSER